MGKNNSIVLTLYESLSNGNKKKATAVLIPDLDWSFHGPPDRNHMMRFLTGDETENFRFKPRRIAEVGKWVVVEGWEQSLHDDAYWVHVWAVDGEVITKFREYFNTHITIRKLGPALGSVADPVAWESRERPGRPMPGLLLVV